MTGSSGGYNLVNVKITSVMLTEEYIVMLLIRMDLDLLSLYVVTIWFVQRKIRNFSIIFTSAKEKHTNEKHRNAQLRSRPRPRRIWRHHTYLIGKNDQRISDNDRRTGSDGRCDFSGTGLRTRHHLRYGLVERIICSSPII